MTIFHFVRHGESEGNVQAKLAQTTGALKLDIPWETPDIPLSELGRLQARSLASVLPEVAWVYCSTNTRAIQTMRLATPGVRRFHYDARLVDKRMGVFDKLSTAGMKELYPEEWAMRERIGKFFHRPKGGESWLDVIERVWEFMDDTVKIDNNDEVLVFTHDIPIMCAIYTANDMTPDQLMQFQKDSPVGNGTITTLEYEGRVHADVRRTRLDPVSAQPVAV